MFPCFHSENPDSAVVRCDHDRSSQSSPPSSPASGYAEATIGDIADLMYPLGGQVCREDDTPVDEAPLPDDEPEEEPKFIHYV